MDLEPKPMEFGEIALNRADLERAMKILEEGCSGNVYICFGQKRTFSADSKAIEATGFTITSNPIHCLYGCKNDPDIRRAVFTQKGLSPGSK